MLNPYRFSKAPLFDFLGDHLQKIFRIVFVPLQVRISCDSKGHYFEHFHVGKKIGDVVLNQLYKTYKDIFIFVLRDINSQPLRKYLWNFNSGKKNFFGVLGL